MVSSVTEHFSYICLLGRAIAGHCHSVMNLNYQTHIQESLVTDGRG